jgi:ABC-type glycerol-3-phosphate transport system substrate-binding protein
MLTGKVSRRKALKLGAAASVLPLVHIRTAGAAGTVSIALWDHWVGKQANDVMINQIKAFGEKNKVEVKYDLIPSASGQILMVENAEAQAKTGHDIFALSVWEVHNHTDDLEPVDDVMGRLTAKYGKTNDAVEYLCKVKGHWLAVPSSSGSQTKGPEGRISILRDAAGLDVVKMFPPSGNAAPGLAAWTWDACLKAAEACAKVGKPFAWGLGTTSDSTDWSGAFFAAYGAELVDAKGNITVKSDAVRHVLEISQRLVKVLPKDVVSYDDASNNRALIAGQSAMIFNPPSPWAVALKDAPAVAADTWHFPSPVGPKGRFIPYLPYYWGIWNFSKNKTAAKELCEWLMQRENVEARENATIGFDLPPFASMLDFKIWETAEPPKGTLWNYPNHPWFKQTANIAAMPAPPEIAVQIYNQGTMPTMLAKLMSGQSINDVIGWAQNELEGFKRAR